MSEMHSEGLGEVLENANAEMEKAPCLRLNNDEIQRIVGDMGGEDFSRFAAAKGIDFKSSFQLEINGEKVGESFDAPEEVRAYLTKRFVNEV